MRSAAVARPARPRRRPNLLLLLVALLACAVAAVQAAKDYYAVMGIDRRADDRTIKKAYRKLAQKLHPDKHPDKSDEFVQLSDAYQVLSDPEQRKIYDRYGEDGVKRHQQQAGSGGGHHDPMNVFRNFFGGHGFGGPQGVPRGPGKQYNLEVDLADMYKGRTVTIQHQRSIICPGCDGSGARNKGDIHSCEACSGQGIRIVQQQIAPGFVTRAQMQCDKCRGQGRVIKHKCDRCHGNKVVAETVELEVEISPGAQEGEEIVFEGEADESPDHEAGDVVFRVKSVPSKGTFRRRDTHLYTTHAISLGDALLGFEHALAHFDHVLPLRRTGVTQPGWVQTVRGQGMPRRDGSGHGDLFVEYVVVMPDEIDGDLQTAFEKIFGRPAVRDGRNATHAAHDEL